MNKAWKTILWILAYAAFALCLVLSYPLYIWFFGPYVFLFDGLMLAAAAGLSLIYLRKHKCKGGLLLVLSLPILVFGIFLLLLAMDILHFC